MKQMVYTCSFPYHVNSLIERMCINKLCKSCSFLCHLCIQQDLHSGHHQDLLEISKLPDFVSEISHTCDELLQYLQKQLDNVYDLFIQIKGGIRQKYQLNIQRLESLNTQQVIQALGEMIRFQEQKEVILQNLNGGVIHINQVFENIYSSLQLDNLTYRNISENDKEKARKLLREGEHAIQLGLKLKQNEKFQESLVKIDESLNINPYDPDTLYLKGDCLDLLKQRNEAIVWLNKALEINQNHVSSLYRKGQCLTKLKEYNEALSCFDRVQEIDEKYKSLYHAKGKCLRKLKRYNEAQTIFDKGLEINPQQVKCLQNKGECLRALDKFNEALNCVEQALSIKPNHEQSIATKAWCLKGLGQFQEAIIWFDKALVFEPNWMPYITGKKSCQNKLDSKQ